MLVEFRVKNFRSIRDEQVFSLVASNDTSLKETHVIETEITAVPSILKSAAIYGANASGKSNLIKALIYMRDIVVVSSFVPVFGDGLAHHTFRLDADSANKATEFEITFLIDKVRYQYGFSVTSQRIVAEHLLVYKTAKPQHWFHRYFDEEADRDVYEFKTSLSGPKHVWEEATRPDALFLSTAARLNSAALKPIYDWFNEQLVVLGTNRFDKKYSVKMLGDDENREKICDFLVSADISISNIEVEDDAIRFHHATDSGVAAFDIDDESDGTQSLFALAGPILNILKKGEILVVDELDRSLHPLIMQEFVNLFYKPDVNTGNAQLIFSTHDTSLLNAPALFRRDQIWFTEKDADQATNLIALSDYSTRKNEATERGYLAGRYGGIPFLNDGLKL